MKEELMKMNKDELKYLIYELMLANKFSFQELAVLHEEAMHDKIVSNNELITELAFTAVMLHDKKLSGDKKLLDKKFSKAIISSKVFAGTDFEKRLSDN